MKDLQDKVAIVTGGASGIGKSIAQIYAANGAKVVVSDTNDNDGEAVAAELRNKGYQAIYVHADVSKPADCQQLVAAAVQEWGALHIACNNAGISGQMAATADMSIEAWEKVISVNLSGVFYCMKYQIPEMLKAGGGSIVNISSILGQVAFAGAPAYTAAKHGLVGLTRATALEYGTAGIRVNSVGPAFIRTPMISIMDDATLNAQIAPLHALGRLGTPDEVAELVLWLSSSRSSFATGAYYPIDGGYLAR